MRYGYVPGSEAAHTLTVAPPRPERAATHRIIVPMRDVTAAELARLPDANRLAVLMSTRGARCGGLTYAMAEEIATATLVELVALRFVLADGSRGVAVWRDWRWGEAIVPGTGRRSLEALEALITGSPWPPPAVTCPRCGTAVRENKDGTPRAHGTKRRCKGYWPSLMDRSWGMPIHPNERIAK